MKRFDLFEINKFDSITPRSHELCECEDGDYVLFEEVERLQAALREMIRLYGKLLECVDSRNTCYDAECISLMNTAPNMARDALSTDDKSTLQGA